MRTGGHWSRPAAWRTLETLVRLGGHGTTFAIANVTKSVAVHQDIYSLRCWLQFDHGYPERDTHLAVRREDLGLNPRGRKVVNYILRPDVRQLYRRLWHAGYDPGQGPPTGEEEAPAAEPESSSTRPAQGLLFQTEGALSRRRKAERS